MAKRALLIVHSYYMIDTRPRRHATALADAGWDVDVLCARDAGESPMETFAGVRIHRLPARRRRGGKWRYLFEYASFTLMALGAAAVMHARRRYRVVYVMGIPNALVFAALVPRLTGARVLLDMRDPFPEFLQAKYELSERHPLTRALLAEERLSCRFASQVLTVHPSVAELHSRSVPRERITVVMNAPDPRIFSASADGIKDPDDRTILYTGTVGYRHGVDLAVRAVASLCDEIPKLRLRLVGDGDQILALRRLASEQGIEDRVSFEPFVPIDRVPGIAGESWLGVQPNRPDAFMRLLLPTKVLEWCRLGLPVVCGTTLPLLESFTADEIMFHEPGDLDGMCARILEAHRDPDALQRRVERARSAADRIRYEDQIAALLGVVEPRI